MTSPEAAPPEGVQGLDHTADLGLEIRAPDLPELFRRAALGAMWLVLEREVEAGPESSADPWGESRDLHLVEEDLHTLLRSWLRALLFWEETEGFVVLDAKIMLLPTPLCRSPDGQAFGLQGQVRGCFDPGPRVREIKGVTLHGLRVEMEGDEWLGRVIFDV